MSRPVLARLLEQAALSFKHALFAPQPGDLLANLGDDLLLEVLQYLSLWEVLTLRLVSRRYFRLTYTPVVWKRLIQDARLTLPALPPFEAYSLENAPVAVCEQVLRRAQALHNEWRRGDLRVAHTFVNAFNTSHRMVLLPGGRYLVVACLDEVTNKNAIIIWDLEFPSDMPFLPSKRRAAVARVVIPGPVEELKAKYMKVLHNKAIVIAAHVVVKPDRYYWMSLSITLDVLGNYANAATKFPADSPELMAYLLDQRPPFSALLARETSSRLCSLGLETIRGEPYAVVVKDGVTIVLQNLDTGRRTFITPSFPVDLTAPAMANQHTDTCTIRKIKVLSIQNQIFVIREVVRQAGDEEWPVFTYEFFDIPPSGAQVMNPTRKGALHFDHELKSVDHFEITEDGFFDRLDEYHTTVTGYSQPKPSDIHIWYSASELRQNISRTPGAALLVLTPAITWKDEARGAIESYEYVPKLNRDVFFASTIYPNERPVHFLGGSSRSIWIQAARRNREITKPDPRDVAEFIRFFPVEGTETPTPEDLKNELKALALPTRIMKDIRDKGLAACAFDEGIGRLVLATVDSPLIHILDYADHIGVKWDEEDIAMLDS